MKLPAFALAAVSAIAVILSVLVLWFGLRLMDPYFWPQTGIARVNYAVKAPTRAASLGRDCFVQNDESNLIGQVTPDNLQDFLVACAKLPLSIESDETSNSIKRIGRCSHDSMILERSVLVFRGAGIPLDVCTVSLFNKESDLGVGKMTMSSYEPAPNE